MACFVKQNFDSSSKKHIVCLKEKRKLTYNDNTIFIIQQSIIYISIIVSKKYQSNDDGQNNLETYKIMFNIFIIIID